VNQPYFIVVLAHSLHGRLRRVHVPYQFLYLVLVLALFGAVSLFGFVSSYTRMALKVANYNNLRHEVEVLRARYSNLEKETKQKGLQLASLQLLASEVSVAYGINKSASSTAPVHTATSLMPSLSESLEQYNFLKSANFDRFSRRSSQFFASNMLPSIWPVDGQLMSTFGNRSDPFSGLGAFHAGVDISAARGTPIKVTADGVVSIAEWLGDFGRLVVVDHGNGYQTYYAHLSRFQVVAGQWVRRGEIVGLSGATGRATSAHLHYEVRRNGTSVNPHRYLNSTYAQAPIRGYGL
jgi:murein DD-endopeptidase MepM/ murein hydrolase activator NlpD